MKRFLITISTILFITFLCVGQDTIKYPPSIFYSGKKETIRGKSFASKAKYAREDIIFSKNKKRIEYCYYYDTVRVCYGSTYEIYSDSVLKIDDKSWIYKKRSDKYFLYRFYNGTYESGYAKTLIPLEAIGLFVTTTTDKIDTLWTTDYLFDKPSNPYDHPKYIFNKSRVAGKIYDSDQIDDKPTFINGDTISVIKLKREVGCFCEPLFFIRSLSFIITKNGRIVNIEQNSGNFDSDFCPYYMLDLIRSICQLGILKPAKVKGENVNVKWVVKVDMDE